MGNDCAAESRFQTTGWFSLITLQNADGAHERLARICQEEYAVHQLVWRLFPDEERRRFLYRLTEQEGMPACYVVSASKPQDTDGIWRIQSRLYHPQLQVGERLVFALRANPVVARKGQDGRSRRHDVVMDAKKRAVQTNANGVGYAVGQVGEEWLATRSVQNGFRLEKVAVEGYRQHRLRGRAGKICFSTLDFEGVLTVMDPDLLQRSLWIGIGPAKGFGCGLLLIKRR